MYVFVRVYRKDSKNDSTEEVERWMTPHDAKKLLKEYGYDIITEYIGDYMKRLHVPMRGACDSKAHIVTHTFEGNNGEMLVLKTESIKSKDDNCLLVAMSSVSDDKTRAHKLRKELEIEEGPISEEECDRIAERLSVTYALYRVECNTLEVVCESDHVS